MTPGRSQHRSLLLLAVVLGIQILLLATQVKRDQDVRLIRVWAVEAVAPLGRAATWLADGIRGTWTSYIGVRGLGRENERLRAENDQFKLRNAELEGRAAEADRLAALFDFRKKNSEVPMLAARIIGASPSISGRVAFLDRGSRDGLAQNMGVITPEGVVGKLIAVYPATSQVLLVSDKESGVGALLADTRTQAPVRGSGDPLLQMEYVAKDVKVRPGEAILTSGQDRIFPKDLPVGVVQTVSPDPRSPFHRIVVRPAARLDRLEEVLVLLTLQELEPGTMTMSSQEESDLAAPAPAATSRPAAPVTVTPTAQPVQPATVSAPVRPQVMTPAAAPVPPEPPAATPEPAPQPAVPAVEQAPDAQEPAPTAAPPPPEEPPAQAQPLDAPAEAPQETPPPAEDGEL